MVFIYFRPRDTEDELADALEDMARDIALIEPKQGDWGGWVTYLLERMEKEARRRGKESKFEYMLNSLKKELD